jgi:hypothetical protein
LITTVPVGIVAGTSELTTWAVTLIASLVVAVALGEVAVMVVAVLAAGAAVTTNESADDVDPENDALPGVYSAVIDRVPTANEVVASDETMTGEPDVAEPTSDFVAPIWVTPLKNFTVPPVSVPETGATVVENITLVPATCGLTGFAVGVVVVVPTVGTLVTTNDSAEDVEPENDALPAVYCAVIDRVPTASEVVASEVTVTGEPDVAEPTSDFVAPIWVTPSKNFTVPPVSVPEAGATVVEKVTLVPATCGLTGLAVGVVVVVATAATGVG